MPTTRERNFAMGVHIAVVILAFLTSWSAGIAGVLAAGVIYFVRPLDSNFVLQHAREALNFNLTMFLLSLAAVVVLFLTLGLGIIIILPLALIIALVWLYCSVMAAGSAYSGRYYKYPFSLKIFK